MGRADGMKAVDGYKNVTLCCGANQYEMVTRLMTDDGLQALLRGLSLFPIVAVKRRDDNAVHVVRSSAVTLVYAEPFAVTHREYEWAAKSETVGHALTPDDIEGRMTFAPRDER